jgi:hypothetical protein
MLYPMVQAPAKPKTPYGEMLQYYLKMEPQLFRAAVDQQLQRLKEEKDAKQAAASQEEDDNKAGGRSKSELVLYQRMEEVRAMEVRATLEDLMYVSILEKFIVLGVDMLPRLDGKLQAAAASVTRHSPLQRQVLAQPQSPNTSGTIQSLKVFNPAELLGCLRLVVTWLA